MAKAKRSAAEIAKAMLGGRTPATAASSAKTTAPKAVAPKAAKPAPAAKPSAKPTTVATLASCVKLAEAGEWATVIDGLLAAWRATPSSALGNTIVTIGERLRQPLDNTGNRSPSGMIRRR